jgi:hypothetical protein
MHFRKSRPHSDAVSRLETFTRLPALALLAGLLQSGCMESSPGSSQGESRTEESQALRAMAANPLCKVETHLLILDEDAIRNPDHCGCDRGNGYGRNDDRDNDKDGGKRDCKRPGLAKQGSGEGKGGDNEIRYRTNGGKDDHGDGDHRCDKDHGHGRDEGDSDKAGCDTSAIGRRSTLKSFANRIGQEIILPSGSVGDEGWFAPTTIRIAWKNAGPEAGDGLRNYLAAGPGLGSPDAKGNKESLLENVPDLTPLRAMGLARLEGSSICGVVLDGDVKMGYKPLTGDIRGPNLGKVAFQVLGLEPSSGQSGAALPGVRVRILDADAACAEPFAPIVNAPAPVSASEPKDVEKPSCSVLSTLISEPWNAFDSVLWRGDGDQLVQDGFFLAREGASSAAADYISPCPVPVEANSAVRFTNRLKLVSPNAVDYAESGALFLVNADNDGSFKNYVFINVGYTMAPSKVFVEMFGSNNGADFDQFEETSVPYGASQTFNLDLWIQPDAFQVAVAEEVIDTVRLASPIAGVGLFEVGVQQNDGGLRGLVDMTTLSKMCQKEKETIHRCRPHSRHRGKAKERMSRTCRNRNAYIRLAKERIKHCSKPSVGLRLLASMKEKPE